jgi:hypothetical protein
MELSVRVRKKGRSAMDCPWDEWEADEEWGDAPGGWPFDFWRGGLKLRRTTERDTAISAHEEIEPASAGSNRTTRMMVTAFQNG